MKYNYQVIVISAVA